MTMPSQPRATPRRELATRDARWAAALARWLGRRGMRPNGVSMAGVIWALVAAAAFALVPQAGSTAARIGLLVLAAASIQLRLLCNLLDGMLAIEGGFKSKTGDIYNEVPDRIADVVILVGAGYAVRDLPSGVTLGWTAAVLAVFTAYLRVFAGSLGLRQHFIGPMAKQHRMFALTVAALLAAAEAAFRLPPRALYIGLVVIIAGAIVTAIRRVRRMAAEISAR
jgi:phosphatidylglycerophosphate synthase